jgi:phage head maturation protease
MKIYFPIAKVDAERREVWGYASTETRDDQGEIVTREALTAALGDYMKFANIREMHQLSAVGVAQEAGVDEKGLYIGAKIVDDQAWRKVTEGVYKGYSIGGRVTERDPADYRTITGIVLNEISLVDRPANPEAIFDCWRAAMAPAARAEGRFNPPVQVWACGVPDHRHLAKADALKCIERRSKSVGTEEAADEPYGEVQYADPGFQPDRKKRYPIDTERHIRAAWNFINRPENAKHYSPHQVDEIKARIVAAWKKMIDRNGPPSLQTGIKVTCASLRKALSQVDRLTEIISDLDWLEETFADETGMDDDDASQTDRLRAILDELRAALKSMAAETTSDILEYVEGDTEPLTDAMAEGLAMAAGSRGAERLAQLCRTGGPRMQKLAATLASKAKHSRDDQVLLDLSHHAAARCLGMAGLTDAEKEHLHEACSSLQLAGAQPAETTENPERPVSLNPPAISPNPAGDGADAVAKALDAITAALSKRGMGHQALMDIAHVCIDKLTDGVTCAATKLGARHSAETMGHLAVAHDCLVKAGANCGGSAESEGGRRDAYFETTTTHRSAKPAKALAEQEAEKAGLLAAVANLVPRIEQLAKRVDEIACTPLPPLTLAKAFTAVSKQQDSGAGARTLSAEALATEFAKLSKEEQTLTLIKASYARPMRPVGVPAAPESRDGATS